MKKKIIYGCEERGDGHSQYLTRYTFFDCKHFQICLHVFHRSDAEDLHDHPWPFISVIVWRGYIEHVKNENKPYIIRRRWPGMILFRKAEHRHRVELVKGKAAVSLVIMGKRKRDWGFFTYKGYIQWQKYFTDKGC